MQAVAFGYFGTGGTTETDERGRGETVIVVCKTGIGWMVVKTVSVTVPVPLQQVFEGDAVVMLIAWITVTKNSHRIANGVHIFERWVRSKFW